MYFRMQLVTGMYDCRIFRGNVFALLQLVNPLEHLSVLADMFT